MASFSVPYTTTRLKQCPLSPFQVSKLKLEENDRRAACVASNSINARFGSSLKGGVGVLERPTFDQSQFDPSTQLQQGGDIERLRARKGTGSGDSYRVLLLDDDRHTESLVAKVLPQVVPSVTPDDARRIFLESCQMELQLS